MAISCPSCGLANADDAAECRRCRAPFTPSGTEDISAGLGTLCKRCEAYNEPGVARCTTCGYKLDPDHAAKPAAALDKTAPPPAEPQSSDSSPTGPLWPSEAAATDVGAEQQAPRAGSLPRGWAAAEAAMVNASQRRRAGTGSSIGVPTPPPQPVISLKACASCGAENAPGSKFCSECGTPFARQTPAADKVPARRGAAPAGEELPDDWAVTTDPTGRPAYAVEEERSTSEPSGDGVEAAEESGSESVDIGDPTPDGLGWDSAIGQAAISEENAFASALAEAVDAGIAPEPAADSGAVPDSPSEVEVALGPSEEPEPELPYEASLVIERGNAAGTSFVLGQIENVLGGAGASIELPDDPHLASRHAAVVFDDQRLMLRDEGSANGVYVKLRDVAPIEPGDYFVAGERLLRFDGPCELPVGDPGETPYLGAPRPAATTMRVTEILRGGKTGRVCFRPGPTIAIGRTGCDLNFASDALLAPRHAEVRIAADGSAALVDLNAAPSGVFLRLRPQQTIELQPGDVIKLGDQQLRLGVA